MARAACALGWCGLAFGAKGDAVFLWPHGIVVYPGGGHWLLTMDVEGYEIADWMNERGSRRLF